MGKVFSTETKLSRWVGIIFLFGVFPIIIFYLGLQYEKTIDVVENANVAAVNMYENDPTQEESISGARGTDVENYFKGEWQSDANSKAVMIVKDNFTFYNVVGGIATDSGSWEFRQNLLDSNKFSQLPTGEYLEEQLSVDNPGEERPVLYYEVNQIDDTTLILINLDTGITVSFHKIKS